MLVEINFCRGRRKQGDSSREPQTSVDKRRFIFGKNDREKNDIRNKLSAN